MSIDSAINIDDLKRMAKRRLPKIMFDFIEGGADDERCLARNREAFQRYRLVPRYLVDVSRRDQSCTLLGRTYASPFGISPTGLAGLFRPNADLMLAAEAAAANIPYLMSSASTDSIEEAAKIALSDADAVSFALPLDPPVAVDMTRADVDRAVHDDTTRLLEAILRCTTAAAVKPEQIQSVFLTGGSTAIPAVRGRILGHLPNARAVPGDMFGSVGLGLAIDAQRRFG